MASYTTSVDSTEFDDGTSLPVFSPRQYQRREFLMNWYYERERDVAVRTGVSDYVQDVAWDAYAEIRELLHHHGVIEVQSPSNIDPREGESA
jgi:hypothetical protein